MTLDSLFELAVKRLGSREAVLAELGVSRQRLQNARRGGPPLRAERLVKLGLVAGVEPLEALRAGGREELADLLARGRQVASEDASSEHRALLHLFERLNERNRRLVLHIVRELAQSDSAPAAPQRGRKATSQTRRTPRAKR